MVAAALLLILGTLAGDFDAAQVDRAQIDPTGARSAEIYYASTSAIEGAEAQHDAGVTLRLILASASPQPIIERATPVQVGPTLWRLDLRELQISAGTWQNLARLDPYRTVALPLVSRVDWLNVQLADTRDNAEAYYRIVFSGQRPKNVGDALKLLHVDDAQELRFGLIEEKSGVSVQGVRWLEDRPAARGYAYLTRDVRRTEPGKDFREHLTGDSPFDGQEIIVGRWKTWATTGEQCALQVYLLANGAGVIVERAPVDLVADHSGFRGINEIATSGSCIQCHNHALNAPSTNAVRSLIKSGVDTYADYDSQQLIERFHLTDIRKSLARNSRDASAGVQYAAGLPASDAIDCFRRAMANYDADLDLERCACEQGVSAQRLKHTLAVASAAGDKLPASVAGLVHGRTISRPGWEQQWYFVWTVLQKWK